MSKLEQAVQARAQTHAQVRARLADPEPEIRRIATQDIAKLGAPEACELLLLALGDDDWRVRKEAASVAPQVEPRMAVVFALFRALDDREDIGKRNAAVESLILIGPDAVPGAIDALGRLDADGRKLAVEVLAGAPTLQGMRVLASYTRTDEDVNVVVAAAEALGRAHLAGDEAREFARTSLLDLLESSETSVRLAALDALRRLDAEVPWTVLEPLLDDPLLRRHALAAASGNTTPRALRALAEAVADPNVAIARDAVVALGRVLEQSWGDDDVLFVVTKTLRASEPAHARLRALAQTMEDPASRGPAVLALGLVRDPDDVPLLAEALSDDLVADHAEAALQLFGQTAVEPLLVAGRSAAPSLRGMAISMLPQLAQDGATFSDWPGASEPLAALREGLEAKVPEVIVAALKSLSVVGGGVDVAPVFDLVRHEDPAVAGAAQAALSAIASRHPDAARKLVSSSDAHGPSALAATIALETLARNHQTIPEDAPFLASALAHRDASVRRGAIEALAFLGGSEASTIVTMSLADEDPLVAHAAIRALGKLGRAEQLASLAASTRAPIRLASVLRALREADPERAFAAARPLVRSPESAVASAAVEVVGAVAVDARVDALLGAIDHPDYEVVKLALVQLVNCGEEPGLLALARTIEHAAETVRRYAAELLGHLPGEGAEAILRSRLERERSLEVRRAIMEALSSRSSEAAP